MQDNHNRMRERMRRLAASYTPEWKFSAEAPDAGSVIAELAAGLLAETADRLDRVPHKHKIQYLNLFDGLREEPVEAAKSYVRFDTVAGIDEPVFIPKGTRLLADSSGADGQVVFETAYGITAADTSLVSVVATNGDADAIVPLLERDGDSGAGVSFTAFDTSGDSVTEHLFLLGFDSLFDELHSLRLHLDIEAASPEEREAALELLLGPAVRISIRSQGGLLAFDKVEREDDGILLVKEACTPEKTELGGALRYVLEFTAEQPLELRVSRAELRLAAADLPADRVVCRGVTQNEHHFLPFGEPLEIYADCGIENAEVYARRGAEVELSFDLDFRVVELSLPETETETEYKVVMRRPAAAPRTAVVDVRPDRILFEYFSETGWKRLLPEERGDGLFAETRPVRISLAFNVPADMADAELAGGEPRVRLRLMRADQLYQMPCRHHVPVIGGLRFAYSYDGAPCTPYYACTRNNFREVEVTSHLQSGRDVTLFYSEEHKKPCLYLGFEGAPVGTPLSLYWNIENNADSPVDFTMEYLTADGFAPIKVVDHTAGMLYSEVMQLVVPRDITPRVLFGRERFWIRMINHNRGVKRYRLPVVHGVTANMAKVENLITREELYYPDDSDGPLEIVLSAHNLLRVEVYVNEEGAGAREHWVPWQRTSEPESPGRVYALDPAAGILRFGRNIFSLFPLNRDEPAIRVRYQSYHGAAANVPAGTITTLESSIRFITGVENPVPAYGGYDGFSEESAAAVTANLLRTRGRAVNRQDYFDIISGISCGVRRIKCEAGVDIGGKPREDVFTIALLMEEYEKGGHIFSAAKDAIRSRLLACSSLLPMARELVLAQPHFVRISVRLWVQVEKMETAYDLQKACAASIAAFIDPLDGGFEGSGWEIGVLPTAQQLLAYLKIRHPDVAASRIVMVARSGEREYDVDEDLPRQIGNPFAMAVNGEHIVYVDLTGEKGG